MSHPPPPLYPYRYLYLYRYQVLIGKEQSDPVVGRQLTASDRRFEAVRPRRNGRNTTDWADAQVAGGASRRVPRLLIPKGDT